MYFSTQAFAEKVAQMEIMIPFEVYKAAAALAKRLQCNQYLVILSEWVGGETKPEVKQVTHYVKGFCIAFKLGKELEQQAVIPVGRRDQMGIGKKNRSHEADCADS
jgi:hypothetical protein